MKKQKKLLRILAYGAAMLAAGFAAGFGIAWLAGPVQGAAGLLWILAAMVPAAAVQTIVHEAGHLVGGLATGYRFCSFRVGSWMVQAEQGRLRLRRLSLAGTGGQCLLAPPELREGRIPYVWYNLGGVLGNLLLAVLALLALRRTELPWPVRMLLALTAGIGLLFAVLNGLPMQIGGIDNDGANLLALRRDPEAQRALWAQLKIVEAQSQGLRLKQMPEAWFLLPPGAERRTGLAAAVVMLQASRSMDQHRFAEAVGQMDRLLAKGSKVEGIQRRMLWCDRVCCALLTGREPEILAQWETAEQKQFRRQMKSCLPVLRTEYAYALLVLGDRQQAQRLQADFERAARRWPYPGDCASEAELLALARQAAGC